MSDSRGDGPYTHGPGGSSGGGSVVPNHLRQDWHLQTALAVSTTVWEFR